MRNQAAAPPGYESAGKVMGKLDDRATIHVNHVQLAVEQAIDEPSGCTEAGDGGQKSHIETFRCRDQRADRVALSKIECERPCFNSVLSRQIGRQHLEHFTATRDQNEVEPRFR